MIARLKAALFAVVMRVYPPAFRHRFGDEMRVAFTHRPSWSELASMFVAGIGERRDLLVADIRHTVRMGVRSPLHTTLAVLALGLGIGANTAIFTVVNAVLLRPLPYRGANDLVMLWNDDTNSNKPGNPISPADFADFQRGSRAVVALEGCFSFVTSNQLTIGGQTEMVYTEAVTPGLFPLLGRNAALGDTLAGDVNGTRVVLSDGFWRRRFGGDASVIGRTIQVDSGSFVIAGVMPPDFVFPYRGMLGPTGFATTQAVDLWTPLTMQNALFRDRSGQLVRNVHFLSAIGRLAPGVSVDRADAAFASIAGDLERRYPDSNRGWKTHVTPLHTQVVGDVRPALLLLAASVALILLIACVNVANLVLARSVARRREFATRAALGATRRRLMAQALTESGLLGLAGSLVGVLCAWWGVKALVAFAPDNLPRLAEVHPDSAVLFISIAAGLIAGVFVGAAPAVVAGRADLRASLQDGGRGASGSTRHVSAALVVAEIALALVLAVGAGLLLRSFGKLLDVNPGFRVDHLLTMEMNIPQRLTTPDARRAFYATFFERVAGLPGVVSVGGTTRIPLGSTSVSTTLDVEGRAVPVSQRSAAEFRRALFDYFATMGIPVVRGRAFAVTDGPTAPPVAVINETLARTVFPGEDAVGKHVRFGPGSTGPWTTIVGVIGDIRHRRLDAPPEGEVYVSGVQNPPVAPFIAIRTAGDPAEVAESVRAAARQLDPTMTVYDLRTMADMRSDSIAEQRFILVLIAAFGVLALTLAAVGVYGVMSLAVAQRTQELGIRLALGAGPSQLVRMIVRDALNLAAVGVVVGTIAALALSPLVANQLYGVRPIDPLTFLVMPLLLVAAAVAAALLPARRAMRIDPVQAMTPQ
ncbi:MAG TPA: ABC transporter permease [Vicinamibacterales bacterium]|nr:ABC transporter permease [Vicinamibacterales bacterium]